MSKRSELECLNLYGALFSDFSPRDSDLNKLLVALINFNFNGQLIV